ncbi:hypothetical protein MACH08_20090 [Oceanobacillus kimchii]|uniref:Uncharacterized protein n=1 Tax=Oceanobacillus kimchii TaxID=746691 RepID=A0ABQ5TJQ2_9BACI|nr:hypothetical protein MACH08_20090 [Oceanobacillus kimchii]
MQDSQQILKNVSKLYDKYEFINSDQKLVLMYLKEYEGLAFDFNHISTRDFLDVDISLMQSIIDTKYILNLLEEE